MRIFVTYAREDRAAVEALTRDLTELGHEVWYDGDLKGGQPWWSEILRRITDCDLYLFGLSEPALDSGPCMAELQYAQAAQRPLLPVELQRVRAALMPSNLAEAQFIDYTAADKNAIIKLSAALKRVPAQTPLPDPLPPVPVLPKSRLHDIKQQINSTSELSRNDQLRLLDDLSHELHVKGQRDDVIGMLALFRRRNDVMGDVRDRIDGLVNSAPPAEPVTMVRGPANQPEDANRMLPPPPPPPLYLSPQWPPPQWPPAPSVEPPRTPTGQPWSPGFVVGMIVAGLFCAGLLPLVVGMIGHSDRAKRSQAVTLLWVGGVILVLTLIGVATGGCGQAGSGY
jgi:hypothetical protein